MYAWFHYCACMMYAAVDRTVADSKPNSYQHRCKHTC